MALGCPFHVECPFNNSLTKCPSDELLRQLYCQTRFDSCEIAKRIAAGKPVPVGACPDGNVWG
jgi:hypothetical protein